MRKKAKDKQAFGIIEGQPKRPLNLDATQVKNDYLEILLYQAKQRNSLLGKFSKDGKYELKDEKIINELISLPKKFDEKVDNTVYCSEKLGNFVLNFKLELDISETYCNANLYIIEVENLIDDNIKHTTLLAQIVEPYSPKFKENVYKQWKVYFDENPYEKNDYLFSLLHMQEEEFLFNRELTEILSQLFVMRMLKLLENSGELGEKLQYEYKLLVEKFIAQDPSLAQNYTFLKRLLDDVIVKNKAFDELLKTQEVKMIMAGYCMPIKRIRDKTVPAIIREGGEGPVKKEEKKKEEKKKEEKKPVKKKEKKKEEKKPVKKKVKSKSNSKIQPFVPVPIMFGGKFTKEKLPEITSPKTPTPKKEEVEIKNYRDKISKIKKTLNSIEGKKEEVEVEAISEDRHHKLEEAGTLVGSKTKPTLESAK